MTIPKVEIRPILLLLPSVNHNAPSDPAAMPTGPELGVGVGKFREDAGRGDAADLVQRRLGEPEGAVRPGHDIAGRAGRGGDREFRDCAGGRNAADLVAAIFDEPQGAVRSRGYPVGRTAGRRDRKFCEGSAGCNAADLVAGIFDEPQIAVRSTRDAVRDAA
ncbi:MAG: hypothetical protein V9G24_05855 [Rhodoblastus sp.]